MPANKAGFFYYGGSMVVDKQVKNKGKPHRWKKGESGNPNGRPRKDVCITSIVKKLLSKDAGDGKIYADLVAEVIVDGILDAATNLKHGVNVPLIRELLDRIEGKVAQPLTGAEGEPLIPPAVQFHFADGTVIKAPRNGHEPVEALSDGNGDSPA